MPRLLGYIRVSTRSQEHLSQEVIYRRYWEKHGNPEYYHVIRDTVSGNAPLYSRKGLSH